MIHDTPRGLTFWGLTASPFQLKMQALADGVVLPWSRWPEQATRRQMLMTLSRLNRAKKRKTIGRWPRTVPELDEYPSVPFYWFREREFYYDSSGLAAHLDALALSPNRLIPEDPSQAFVCRLIDEAFDEFGLYMAHHHRWNLSAKSNRMGVTTSNELLGRFAPRWARALFARALARRQVGRCPYLFSVAPNGLDLGVSKAITPRAILGFPQTHTLLDQSFRLYLSGLEAVLCAQPYLLGDRFTLADASAFGQLHMHHLDPDADALVKHLAPTTHKWLQRIAKGQHRESEGKTFISEALAALVEVISATFVPLMIRNENAFVEHRGRDQSRFNQAAFDNGEALFDGELLGHPFCHVAKTFQVASWRDVKSLWAGLSEDERRSLQGMLTSLRSEHFEPTLQTS